jgi:integrase
VDLTALIGRRKGYTFDSIAKRCMKIKAHKLQPSSIVTYQNMLDCHLSPVFGQRAIGSITRGQMKAFAADLLSDGLSPATVKLALHVASMVFEDACDDEIIVGNPAHKVAEKVLPPSREDARPAKAMTREQLALFLGVARATEGAYYPSFVLMARTGLRISECLSLCWRDLDLEARRLTVRRSKNGRPRTIPLTADMTRMLGCMTGGMDSLVFLRANGRPFTHTATRAAMKRILKKAALPAHFHVHSLRHSCLSLLEQEGAGLDFISRLAGHSDLKTTKGYAYNLPVTGWAVVDRLMTAVPVVLPDSAPKGENNGNHPLEAAEKPNTDAPSDPGSRHET